MIKKFDLLLLSRQTPAAWLDIGMLCRFGHRWQHVTDDLSFFQHEVTGKAFSTLTKSRLPSDYFQRSLPRLEIPKLENTVDRYLRSQRALLDKQKMSVTESYAKAFLNGRGQNLQKELQSFADANRSTSYISEMWFDMYLSDRRPVALTHNPVLVFDDTKLEQGYAQPVIRATNLTYGILKFCRLLRSNELEPEIFHLRPSQSKKPLFFNMMKLCPTAFATYGAYAFKAFPLDMSQFWNMFNATRIARQGRDQLFVDTSARHLLVIHRGQYYVFDVFTEGGEPTTAQQILSNLVFIASQPKVSTAPGLGSLTVMDRDSAAMARQRLTQLGNDANLRLVDTALFALVLDDAEVEQTECSLLKNLLAGESESRWFDKSLSLIVDRYGHAGINFEHSWGDGVAVLRLCNELAVDSDSLPAVHPPDLAKISNLPNPTVRRLEWLLDDHFVTDTLLQARRMYDRKRTSLVVNLTINDRLTRENCRNADVSPDAMMQLAFQMSYSQIHSRLPTVYESCSTAAFKHGRTETIRPVTLETRDCVALMLKSLKTPEPMTVFEAIKKCSDKHKKLTMEAAMGKGWDRHLFALRRFSASETGRALPELFLDEAYTNINNITLSTSSLSSPHVAKGMFAPVHDDGYGIAYVIQKPYCGVVASTWDDASTARSKQFIEAFTDNANRISNILQQFPPSTQ